MSTKIQKTRFFREKFSLTDIHDRYILFFAKIGG